MSQSLFLYLSLTLASSAALLAVLMLRVRSLASAGSRLHAEPARPLKGRRVALQMAANALLSGGLVFGATFGLTRHLFQAQMPAWWRLPLQALAILAAYDFLYYFMHRYLFHRWGVLRRVHAVHHRVRAPTAIDSLYMHPVENIAGLGLFVACTWLVGPVHPYAYTAAFFIYSHLNIVIHGGLAFSFPLRYAGLMAKKHDRHHQSMKAGNYASISPVPDLLFGTVQ